jgi:transposase InsO family protein
MLVKPETVLRWHKRMVKQHWKRKSQGGRPKVSCSTISLIKRIHKENPTLSPEKIHERIVNMNIFDAPAPNTIAKYIRAKRKPPSDKQTQSWKSFLHNHAKGIWAMDFATVSTLTFRTLHVLIILAHDRRRIVHFAVTENPSAQWMIQQIRNATPFGIQPIYLLHDNSSIFIEKHFQRFIANLSIKSKRITPYSPWQNGICERLIGIMRRELFDHIIPLNERHLESLLKEYVEYYNNIRTHQALNGETPVKSTPLPRTATYNTVLCSKPILGGLYHNYEKHSRYKTVA